jgi:hypothetical protein
MKHLLLIAGAVALGFAAPAAAKPGMGHGNGQGHGQGLGYDNAYGLNGPVGYGAGGCPPGLAKKNPPCVPPGIAKQQFGIGQRFAPSGFSPYAYNQIPYDLRSQYGLNPYNRYYYGNGYLYGVNPRTMLVQQVIGALLGRY